VKDQ